MFSIGTNISRKQFFENLICFSLSNSKVWLHMKFEMIVKIERKKLVIVVATILVDDQ